MLDPKELIEKYVEEVLNQRNYKVYDELIHDHFWGHQNSPIGDTKDEYLNRLKNEDNPDMIYELENVIADTDRAFVMINHYYPWEENDKDASIFKEFYRQMLKVSDNDSTTPEQERSIMSQFSKAHTSYWVYHYKDDQIYNIESLEPKLHVRPYPKKLIQHL